MQALYLQMLLEVKKLHLNITIEARSDLFIQELLDEKLLRLICQESIDPKRFFENHHFKTFISFGFNPHCNR